MTSRNTHDPARTWICLPTYNECDNVAPMVERLLGIFDSSGLDGRVLIIDDSSTDGTGAIADALAAKHERVQVLHRHRKEGLGPAYRDGFRVALEGGADLVVEMDCDFSHDPDDMPRLIAATAAADLVLGSRYVAGGRIEDWGMVRRLVSRGGCLYAKWILGLPVRDLTGGFKCFRREVLQTIPLDQVASAGYVFQVEMTYRAARLGFVVEEVPITFRERARGTSKMSWRILLEAIVAVPRLRHKVGTTPNR